MHCSRTANAALQAIYAFYAVLAMLETRPKLCQRVDLYKENTVTNVQAYSMV